MTNTLNTSTISTVAGLNGTSGTYTLAGGGGGGGSGSYLISSGNSFNNTYSIADNVMTVNGSDSSLTVKGKVIINGLDLEERLKIIEKVLGIPERDATIEAKYPSIKKKFDEYINSLEKYRTFERIKGTENE